MVGHLALVQDDAAAWVISWHIGSDMDCYVTKTTAAAKTIDDETQGRQQVMPLEGVYVNPGESPLPHIRNGRSLFNPTGNPVLARDLLIYPPDQESCKLAFKNILGPTILIDDLDSGNHYRRMLALNRSMCPTILTRQGDSISSKGKFGGSQNKAPPPNNRSKMFGAPMPQHHHMLMEQIDLLQQYCSAVLTVNKNQGDYEAQQQKMKSEEWQKSQQEMESITQELDKIDRECASEIRPVKRGPPDAEETSDIIAKRTRSTDSLEYHSPQWLWA
ncbi:structural maintenance of chromosomes flexible hinge domain-containing protein 1 [Nelusetta ayraudi]|uniref:structural maintenance of chromosomes flexible hinge domain-containing protein 1 n=1 Tax=Nelusetta ayraudi TaxID=303726 RepID=UPI003F72972C